MLQDDLEFQRIAAFLNFPRQLWSRAAADHRKAREELPQLSLRPRRRSKRRKRTPLRHNARESERASPWRYRSMRRGDVIGTDRCGKVTSRWRHRSLCARRRDEIAIIIIGGLTSPYAFSLSLCAFSILFPYCRNFSCGYGFRRWICSPFANVCVFEKVFVDLFACRFEISTGIRGLYRKF